LDARSERNTAQIMSDQSWQESMEALNTRFHGCEHVFCVVGVPPVFASFALMEKVLELMPGFQDLEDDTGDHWGYPPHWHSRDRLFDMLLTFSERAQTRVTLLAGDVHVAACGLIEAERSGVQIYQPVSSGICAPPPPSAIITAYTKFFSSPVVLNLPNSGKIRTRIIQIGEGRPEMYFDSQNFLLLTPDNQGGYIADTCCKPKAEATGHPVVQPLPPMQVFSRVIPLFDRVRVNIPEAPTDEGARERAFTQARELQRGYLTIWDDAKPDPALVNRPAVSAHYQAHRSGQLPAHHSHQQGRPPPSPQPFDGPQGNIATVTNQGMMPSQGLVSNNPGMQQGMMHSQPPQGYDNMHAQQGYDAMSQSQPGMGYAGMSQGGMQTQGMPNQGMSQGMMQSNYQDPGGRYGEPAVHSGSHNLPMHSGAHNLVSSHGGPSSGPDGGYDVPPPSSGQFSQPDSWQMGSTQQPQPHIVSM